MIFKNKIRQFSLSVCILMTFFTLKGQTTLHGVLVDSLTQKPIHSANILYGTNGSGTITNLNGEFQVFISKESSKQKIRISHINYKTKSIWLNKDTILLVSKRHELDEVVVTDMKKLIDKIVASFIKKKSQNSYCEKFFYKQFLKQNGKYINYLEAIGKTQIKSNNEKNIYIKDLRATNNLVEEYVRFNYTNLYLILKRASIDIIKNSKIISHTYLNGSTLKITLKTQDNKQELSVFLNLSDNSIIKISKNTLNNQLKKNYLQKVLE